MLLTKRNVMNLAKACVRCECDTLIMAASEHGTNFCVVASGEPMKNKQDGYLLVRRLLNQLKSNLDANNGLELNFTLKMKNEGGKNGKTAPDHEARRSVRNRRKR